jgi:biotin-dependent carboxylase-like uncharacterized protein
VTPGHALRVLAVGPLVTVQDHGRPGHAATGVGTSGAVDRRSHDLANRLVGNAASAATLEVLLGGLVVQAEGPCVLAVTGAEAPLRVDGRPAPLNALLRLRAGQRLEIGTPRRGLRTYVAVRGGIDVPAVLGSRSTDTLSGLGPDPVRAGDVLAPGTEQDELPPVDHAPVPPVGGEPVVLPYDVGPRADWFTPDALTVLERAEWRVSTRADRIGVRLDGPALQRAVTAELPTEAMVLGAVQVPPAGPIVFADDHPVTGGYPVIAVVTRDGLDRLAQAAAGTRARFVPSGSFLARKLRSSWVIR